MSDETALAPGGLASRRVHVATAAVGLFALAGMLALFFAYEVCERRSTGGDTPRRLAASWTSLTRRW